jgi:cytochrome bd-type quinol oxidase subunit 1
MNGDTMKARMDNPAMNEARAVEARQAHGEETMVRTSSHPAPAGERAQGEAWGRRDAMLFALAALTLALIAVQFALAGFGAFTMDKTPTDNAYGAHMVLGIVTGALAWLILAAVLTSRPARTHLRTLRLAVTLAVLSLPVEPVLGDTGQQVPVLGALHALTGLVICALTGWLLAETGRRRAAATRLTATSGAGAQDDRL